MKSVLQLGIRFTAESHSAEVTRIVSDFAHEAFDMAFVVRKISPRCARMTFECVVNRTDVWNLTSHHREVVAHESIKVRAVGLLAEVQFHRTPELFIELRLKQWLQAHQDEIADKVGLA